MTNLTETPAVSGLRVLDIAHRVISELGTWQYHPALTIDARTNVLNTPQVIVGLVASETAPSTREAFLDDLARVLGSAIEIRSHDNARGTLRSVSARNWSGSGVLVYAAEYVAEVAR